MEAAGREKIELTWKHDVWERGVYGGQEGEREDERVFAPPRPGRRAS